MAKLHFNYSAMNAGKTTDLLQVAHQYNFRGAEVIVAKPRIDSKGGDKIVSRLGGERAVDLLIEREDLIADILVPTLVERPISCVLVDEAQFLEPQQVDDLYWQVSTDHNTPVMAFGLRADFLGQPFPGSERLLALADELEEVDTLCRCENKARFNTRMVDGVYVFEGDQVAIDGEGEVAYDSLCKNCYRAEYLAWKATQSGAIDVSQAVMLDRTE